MATLLNENKQWVDNSGKPIVNGFVYVGQQNLDPVLNPESIYSDRTLTTVLANPQRTDASGRAENKIWVPGKYSLKVTDSAGVQKLLDLDRGESGQVGNTLTIDSIGINDITCTGSPTQTEYVDGQSYIVTAPADNTDAMTVKIDTLPVIPIKKLHDQPLLSGDVKAGMKLDLVYNSTDNWMELQSSVERGSVVVQRVYTQTGAAATTTSQIPIDDTIPQNTEGLEVMTLAITPQSTLNILEIKVTCELSADDVSVAALFQDSTANALAAFTQSPQSANFPASLSFVHSMVAGTVSQTTFKVRIGKGSALGTQIGFNGQWDGTRRFGGVAASSIVITEYTP